MILKRCSPLQVIQGEGIRKEDIQSWLAMPSPEDPSKPALSNSARLLLLSSLSDSFSNMTAAQYAALASQIPAATAAVARKMDSQAKKKKGLKGGNGVVPAPPPARQKTGSPRRPAPRKAADRKPGNKRAAADAPQRVANEAQVPRPADGQPPLPMHFGFGMMPPLPMLGPGMFMNPMMNPAMNPGLPPAQSLGNVPIPPHPLQYMFVPSPTSSIPGDGQGLNSSYAGSHPSLRASPGHPIPQKPHHVAPLDTSVCLALHGQVPRHTECLRAFILCIVSADHFGRYVKERNTSPPARASAPDPASASAHPPTNPFAASRTANASAHLPANAPARPPANASAPPATTGSTRPRAHASRHCTTCPTQRPRSVYPSGDADGTNSIR